MSVEGHVLPFGIDYNLCADPDSSWLLFKNEQISDIVLVTADVTLKVLAFHPTFE